MVVRMTRWNPNLGRSCTDKLLRRSSMEVPILSAAPNSSVEVDAKAPPPSLRLEPRKANFELASKHSILRLFDRFFSFLFISVHVSSQQFLSFVFVALLFSQINAYVYRQEGATQSHIYKRLMGRQRRDAQREILTTLGLSHRPRVSRSMEISSAPLYMLGLYKSASHFRAHDNASYPMPGSVNLDSMLSTQTENSDLDREEYDLPLDISTDLNRQIEDSGILSREIGIIVPNSNSDSIASPSPSPSQTPNEEKQLLDQSDVIVSYINTRQQQGTDVFLLDSLQPARSIRHRTFHFETTQTSTNERLLSASFRLYKERSDILLGNQTLRVQMFQTVRSHEGSSLVNLLGTRLVEASQEGWLVYDATSLLREWIARPESNLGIKVTVENMEGRYLKPIKTGLVGRRGSASKQAFIVAFFTQETPELLKLNVKKRYRRNAVTNLQSGFEPESGTFDNDSTADNRADDVTDSYDADTDSVEENDTRAMTKRKTKDSKTRKKGKKRNRPKNSSKRKPVLEHCQRKQFYVDFKDLGWHTWIIAPKAYKAYQCLGACSFPLNAGLNATNHAIVQSLVHERLQELHIPEPCCAPSKLEPLEILFFNDQTKVIYKKYRDMVVSSCGCH